MYHSLIPSDEFKNKSWVVFIRHHMEEKKRPKQTYFLLQKVFKLNLMNTTLSCPVLFLHDMKVKVCRIE